MEQDLRDRVRQFNSGAKKLAQTLSLLNGFLDRARKALDCCAGCGGLWGEGDSCPHCGCTVLANRKLHVPNRD